MSTSEVWYAIPSANVERCRETLPKWREMGYKIAILQNQTRGEIPADIVVWSDHYPGWPGSINQLCASIVPKSASIVVSGGDDMLPDPNRTAQDIASEFHERFPDGFGIMQPIGDEFWGASTFCGSPWLGRGWIERAYGGNGPMPAQYRHNWADNEIFWVARCMDALWLRKDLTQYHKHFIREGGVEPEYWTKNVEGFDRHDMLLYILRSWQRFPGCEVLDVPGAAARLYDHAIYEKQYTGKAEEFFFAKFGAGVVANSCVAKFRKALEACAKAGRRAVAVYGAGTHTRSMARILMDAPCTVRCIIDDNAKLWGKTLWNFPIVSREEALRLGVDAVVLSSDSMEQRLFDNARIFMDAGIEVLRLYPPEAAEGTTPAINGPTSVARDLAAELQAARSGVIGREQDGCSERLAPRQIVELAR